MAPQSPPETIVALNLALVSIAHHFVPVLVDQDTGIVATGHAI